MTGGQRSDKLCALDKSRRRLIVIETWCRDEWSGFANLLADLIEKYAAVLDVDNLPEPCGDNENENGSKLLPDAVETMNAA